MSLVFAPMAAFGSVVVVCSAEAGDTREVALNDDFLTSSGNYFYTKGTVSVKVKETGEVLQPRTAGWLNTEHANSGASSTGTLELSFTEPTQWLCMPHSLNKSITLPSVSSVVVAPGATTNLAMGANLFLVRGEFEINSRVFTGPTQVRVRSGAVVAKNVSANTNYALLFV